MPIRDKLSVAGATLGCLVLATVAVSACGGSGGPKQASPAPHASPDAGCGPTGGAGEAPWPVFGGGPEHPADDPSAPGRAGRLRRVWESPQLDGAAYGQALVAGGCVYVATEDDSVYALDALNGSVRWRAHLASPVTGGLPCGDISPSGITGTPVLDPLSGLIWAAIVSDGAHGAFHQLVGLSALDGRVVRRQRLSVPGTAPAAEQQRAALVAGGGNVYVAFGGLYGDCSNYLGAVASVPETGARPPVYWHVPTARGAGIWEPGGPDILPDGRLLLADGNGAAGANQPFDGSNAVYELTPGLAVAGYFAPSDWAKLNGSDLDLGSTGPAVLPGGLALAVGKDGVGYLVSTTHPGGTGHPVASGFICSGGAYGSDAVSGATVYVPCSSGVTAVAVGRRSFHVIWRASAGGAGELVVAGGEVFEETGDGRLVGLASSDGKPVQALDLPALATHFPWLVAVGSRLYAPAANRVVAFSGL
jgi:outer membrane protein assembly factor BamB